MYNKEYIYKVSPLIGAIFPCECAGGDEVIKLMSNLNPHNLVKSHVVVQEIILLQHQTGSSSCINITTGA